MDFRTVFLILAGGLLLEALLIGGLLLYSRHLNGRPPRQPEEDNRKEREP